MLAEKELFLSWKEFQNKAKQIEWKIPEVQTKKCKN